MKSVFPQKLHWVCAPCSDRVSNYYGMMQSQISVTERSAGGLVAQGDGL